MKNNNLKVLVISTVGLQYEGITSVISSLLHNMLERYMLRRVSEKILRVLDVMLLIFQPARLTLYPISSS